LSNVVTLGCVTYLDLPADRILEGAAGKLESVVLCGWDKDGEPYFASSLAGGGDVLWLLEKCKARLLQDVD